MNIITTGEVYEAKPGTNYHNYDFIGTINYPHSPDLKAMGVDSSKINNYWCDYSASGSSSITRDYRIKGNGIFLPSVATVKVNKGEMICGYKSVYQDPVLSQQSALITAGGWYNGSPAPDSVKMVLNRNLFDGNTNSAVGCRYIPTGGRFRTAYLGLPLSFMDNSNNAVYDNMKALINWFDLTIPPRKTGLQKHAYKK